MVTAADGKELPAGFNGIAATPLVSVQGGKTYVYFTVNSADSKDYVNYSAGGGVYRYTLGDAEATQIYDAAGHYQHCDSPVIADASGNLYYINDSGTLFKLGAVESWTVAFNSNGGSACDTKFVATADGKLVKPADPTRDGYTFGGWFTDEACTQAYDFSTPVTADLTLYAKWTRMPLTLAAMAVLALMVATVALVTVPVLVPALARVLAPARRASRPVALSPRVRSR